MALPPTYYDFILKNRPYVVELAARDAQFLQTQEPTPVAIASVDDYNSRFPECFEKVDQGILGQASRASGISLDEIRPHLPQVLPELRAQFASLYATVNHEYHCMVNFELANKKCFHFSDNLSTHLSNTEINLKARLVELPFPTCLFVFTSATVINAMHNIRGAEGRREMNTGDLDYAAPVSAFLTLLPAGGKLLGRKLVIVAWHAKPPAKSYLMLKRELYLGDGWSLEQSLRTDWEKLTPDDLGCGINIEGGGDIIEPMGDETFYTDGLAFYRIMLNAALYLASDQAELTTCTSPRAQIEIDARQFASVPKKKRMLKQAAEHSCLDYAEVGASLGPIVIEPGTAASNSSESAGSKPQVRFMVRGHWRHQPHGPGASQRRLIWIRPHYKGPDIADLINKPYLVK